MKNRVVFLFPGQGAQYVGMGRDFYQHYPVAREVFDRADALLGRKLSSIIFEGPEELLIQTEQCQLAIFINSMAILAVIKDLYPALVPSVCAGLSLGEYSAVCATGRIPFEETLFLVQTRACAMQRACEMNEGKMAAIFGLTAEQVEAMVHELNLPEDLWVANYNCPGQTVISGTARGIEMGSQAAKAQGAKRVIPLKVHGAFHSGLMKSAQEAVAQKTVETKISHSGVPLVMNVTGSFVTEIEEVRANLVQQVTHSVRWEQSMRAIGAADLYLEIGCGKTLTGMLRQMQTETKGLSINSVSDLEQLAAYKE